MKKEELTNLFMTFVEEKFPEMIEEDKMSFSDGDQFYSISFDGKVNDDYWSDHQVDRERLSIGNAFKTEGEAKFAVEKLKVIHELSELTRPFSYGSDNWCLYLNSEGEIDYYTEDESQFLYGDYYFDSREEAIRAVEQIGMGRIRKYLFKEY